MNQLVKIRFEVHCMWIDVEPKYRIYVNDEMFCERTFIWDKNTHIKEMLQLSAPQGIYEYRLDQLTEYGQFEIINPTVEIGNARILPNNRFEIL